MHKIIKHIFVNIIISNITTNYHYSSTMVKGMGCTHKLVKNKQRPGVTNNTLNEKLTTLHHYDKYIKRIILAIE